MGHDGSSLRPPPASWLGPVLWLFLLFVLLSLASRVNGQELTAKPNELEQLREHLLKAETYLMTLEANLQKRPEQIATLESALRQVGLELAASKEELQLLKGNLDGSETSRLNLEKALSETSTSLEALSGKYETLSASFAAYRQEMQVQVKALERTARLWRIIAICAAASTVGVAIYAIVK